MRVIGVIVNFLLDFSKNIIGFWRFVKSPKRLNESMRTENRREISLTDDKKRQTEQSSLAQSCPVENMGVKEENSRKRKMQSKRTAERHLFIVNLLFVIRILYHRLRELSINLKSKISNFTS